MSEFDIGIVENRARGDFSKIPFPDRKDQYWRFSKRDAWNVDSLFPFFTSATKTSSDSFLDSLESHVKGGLWSLFYDSQRVSADVPSGISILGMPEASRLFPDKAAEFFSLSSGKFGVLCSSRASTGFYVKVESDASFQAAFIGKLPLGVLNVVFDIAPGATLKLARNFLTFGGAFQAMRFGFFLGRGSVLELAGLSASAENSRRWVRDDFFVADSAKVVDAFAEVGRDHTRIERNFHMRGSGAEVDSRVFVRGGASVVHDIRTLQHHTLPDASSNIAVKSALDGSSRLAFSGLIRVENAAQNTSSYQSARSLLLSDKAEAKASPILEILANDVACSHGCTVSKPDEEQLLYMMSRGLPPKEALKLLVRGFAWSVFERLSDNSEVKNMSELCFS